MRRNIVSPLKVLVFGFPLSSSERKTPTALRSESVSLMEGSQWALWSERPDLPLDLAEAFGAAYEPTTGGRPIPYKTEPIPGPDLTTEDAVWATNLLASVQ